MKVTSSVTGKTRQVIAINNSFFVCKRIPEDALYENPGYPTINVTRFTSTIEYEIGDEVVIVKDWSGYPTSVPSNVGKTGVITNVSTHQQVVVKLPLNEMGVAHEWVYSTDDISPLCPAATIAGVPALPERKIRVLNPSA